MVNKQRLPRVIIPIPNADKHFHEKWSPGRDPLDIPHPFRCVAFGPPHCGKSTTVKNILLRAKPQFEDVVIVHCDPEYTQEYDDIDGELLGEIPAPQDWEGKVKTLVVLDDLEYLTMNKDQTYNLNRLFGFASSHKNISVILCAQDWANVQCGIRRLCNFWILWKMKDPESLATCARKIGLEAPITMFEQFKEPHDSLWLDMTVGTPYPLRKNGYISINKI